ncbi:hypothetical protein HYS91_00960 [Candidatus Daviesbacteria bacterium]|nr:hypothetical protein [Candidatus Daviesbacteria bacterium]
MSNRESEPIGERLRSSTFFNDIARPWAAGAIVTRGLGYLLNPEYYGRPKKGPIQLPLLDPKSDQDPASTPFMQAGGIILIGLGVLMGAELRKITTRRRLLIRATSVSVGVLIGIFGNVTDERS